MQEDFHYYATYCAAIIAGYSHKDSVDICYSSQFVDCCSKTFLTKIGASVFAATTQLSLEMMDARKDVFGLQEITRIWSSFHFLPYDLNAEVKGSKKYKQKFRLICDTNSDLLVDTINLAKKNNSLQAVGVAMHILADTWAHRYFAGTPSLVINNATGFSEIIKQGEETKERILKFRNSAFKPDDIENGIYTSTMHQVSESAVMNLGHGRAGHLPDYSFMRYKYMPAWKNYEEITKDNPSDYYHAFCQMVYALKFLKGDIAEFKKDTYAFDEVEKYKDRIMQIIEKRQLNACQDWKEFGMQLSKEKLRPFNVSKYENQYKTAPNDEKNQTFLGKFILAALAQKSLVTNRIFKSKNILAGVSIDYNPKGLKGIKAYYELIKKNEEGGIQ